MKEASCCSKLVLFKLLTLPQDVYLDDLLKVDTPYFEQIISKIYPSGLQLNKTNYFDTKAHFLELDLSLKSGIVPSNFPFFDVDVPRSLPINGVYISLCEIVF